MGSSEYGWSGSDGTSIYVACNDERTFFRVAIRGVDPKPHTAIRFFVNGQEIVFRTNADGQIDMYPPVAMANLSFLFSEIRSGKTLFVQFDDLAKEIPLKGSAKGLGSNPCE